MLVILSRLLTSAPQQTDTGTTPVGSEPVENRLPTVTSASRDDRLLTLKRLLPYNSTSCYMVLEDESSDPKLVIYSDPNSTYETCGATYFLKQYTDLVKGITVVERTVPITEGVERY